MDLRSIYRKLDRALARSMRETAPTGKRYEHRTYKAAQTYVGVDHAVPGSDRTVLSGYEADMVILDDPLAEGAKELSAHIARDMGETRRMVATTIHEVQVERLRRILSRHVYNAVGVSVERINQIGGVWWARTDIALPVAGPTQPKLRFLPVPHLLRLVAR